MGKRPVTLFGNAFLDHAIEATYRGLSGTEALREAVSNALSNRAARGARQVEEHYYRKSAQGRGRLCARTNRSRSDPVRYGQHRRATRRYRRQQRATTAHKANWP